MQSHKRLTENFSLRELLSGNAPIPFTYTTAFSFPRPPMALVATALVWSAMYCYNSNADLERTYNKLPAPLSMTLEPLINTMFFLMNGISLYSTGYYVNQIARYSATLFQPAAPTLMTLELLEAKIENLQNDFDLLPDESKANLIKEGLVKDDSLNFICPITRSLISRPVEVHLQNGNTTIYEFSDIMAYIQIKKSNQQKLRDPLTNQEIIGYSCSPNLIEKHMNYLLKLGEQVAIELNQNNPKKRS